MNRSVVDGIEFYAREGAVVYVDVLQIEDFLGAVRCTRGNVCRQVDEVAESICT